jgi:glycine dehydrogenase subunit 1
MRYLPLTEDDRRAMLAKVGAPTVESLYSDVPEKVLLKKPVENSRIVDVFRMRV